MGYSKDEMETVLTFDYSTGEWTVYSTVPKHIRILNDLTELDILETEDDRPIAVQGKLNEKQVSMKKVRVMSEEQRLKQSERMKRMWES